VPLLFAVSNPGKIPVTLYLMGRAPTADFLVTDSRGGAVWSLRHGQTLMVSLQVYPLGAGKSLSFRHVWNQHSNSRMPVPAGNYLVRGMLLTDRPGGMESPAARLRIG
jgi:hypothetical protein